MDPRKLAVSLEALQNIGIIKKQVRQLTFFKEKIAPKFGIDLKDVEYSANHNKVIIYSFHDDILFILKARFFEFKRKFNSLNEEVRAMGTVFQCASAGCF